ncbi:MAG: sulfur carrier protein ThiS [Pseudomonadota bacterium]
MSNTIRINGQDEPLTAPTLSALIAERGVTPEGKGIAVAFNGALIRRADWANTPLRAGDTVEIVLARQGG